MRLKTTYYNNPVLNKERARDTLEFMKRQIRLPVLVMGEKKEFESYLEKYFSGKFSYTNHDLNWYSPSDTKYNTILCFEIIEHLLNPLLFLSECKRLMRKKGLLYISYPTHTLKYFWHESHFHEYDKSRFVYLLKIAGLEVVSYSEKTMRSKEIGIRPLLKNTPIGWSKQQYYKLRSI